LVEARIPHRAPRPSLAMRSPGRWRPAPWPAHRRSRRGRPGSIWSSRPGSDAVPGSTRTAAAEPNHSECADPEETRLQHECPFWAQAARELVLAIEDSVGPPPPQ